jgi:hypothetical protein
MGRDMPEQLQHIDAIARQKVRDVLYLEFAEAERPVSRPFEEIESRQQILAWFDENGDPWDQCGPIANENFMASYAGQVNIHEPYDTSNATYQAVQAFLEYPDGTIRFGDVKFWVVSIERAMKNSHHDEPGFWDRWAESF